MNINWEVAADGTATRLVTCEDAVYWAKDGYIWNALFTKWVKIDPNHLFFTIATRPQTKTVADEGEKWTHTYNDGDIKCHIKLSKLDFNGCVVVFNDFEEYQLIQPVDLKPIKPKLTVKEYELLARMAAYFCIRDSEFDEYMSKFDSELTI